MDRDGFIDWVENLKPRDYPILPPIRFGFRPFRCMVCGVEHPPIIVIGGDYRARGYCREHWQGMRAEHV